MQPHPTLHAVSRLSTVLINSNILIPHLSPCVMLCSSLSTLHCLPDTRLPLVYLSFPATIEEFQGEKTPTI